MASFLAPFTILPFSTDDAVFAGRIHAYLAQQGQAIDPCDVLIASQGLGAI